MRLASLAVLVWFGATQTFAFVDCGCESLCRRPNDTCPDAPPRKDCCGGEQEKKAAGPCTHIEPSHEVVSHAADLPAGPPPAEIVATPELDPPAGRGRPASPAPEARGSPPLYLLHSVLLI